MKVKMPNFKCSGCLWLTKENLCPFVRCVRFNGFLANTNKSIENNNKKRGK